MIRIHKITNKQIPFNLVLEYLNCHIVYEEYLKRKYVLNYKLKITCKNLTQITDYSKYKIIQCSKNVILISFINQNTIFELINPNPHTKLLSSIINLKPKNMCKHHSKENKSK